MAKPRLGVLVLASGWMRDVGLDTDGGGLAGRVRETARRIEAGLARHCETVCNGIPASAAEALAAVRAIAAAGCDAVLLAPLVWCEDQVVRAALAGLGDLPLILATLVPHDSLPPVARFDEMLAGSGTVGALQASGMLAREGRPYATVCGRVSDPRCYEEVGAHARAARAARELRGSRLGLLPGRCEAMSVTWVDEFGLRCRTGVELVPVDVARLAAAAAAITGAKLAEVRREIESSGVRVRTDAASFEQGMRVAAGIAAIAAEERLAGLAMDDLSVEMHRLLGLRPCLPEPRLAASGFVVAMEADVAMAVTMRALGLLTDAEPFYTEVFTLDLAAMTMLMGHAGWHGMGSRDPEVGAEVIADVEYRAVDRHQGAALYYALRPGPVTAVNAVWRGGLHWSCFEGESLGGRRLEGNCHLLCRPDRAPDELIRDAMQRGVSQHWAVIPGRRAREVALLAERLGVELAPPYADAQRSP